MSVQMHEFSRDVLVLKMCIRCLSFVESELCNPVYKSCWLFQMYEGMECMILLAMYMDMLRV